MLKQVLLCCALITTMGPTAMVKAQPADRRLVVSESASGGAAVDPAVLAEIAAWLGESFQLPASDPPKMEFVSPTRIAVFRYRGFARSQSSAVDDQAKLVAERETAAVYDDATRTIYLPNGWSGATPAETSVLVHEMVHHLQNGAQLKYECPQAREKLAYAAQHRWLERYGRSLESEFQIDPFTLLVRTRCI